MNLTLTRKTYTNNSTVGELEVDGSFQCFTLEDVAREFKIMGRTAIPAGEYDISFTYSPKYNKTYPLLDDVKNFTGIRIHSGNSDKDTEGCILVGTNKGVDWIGGSRTAFAELYEKFIGALSLQERIKIKIIDTQKPRLL